MVLRKMFNTLTQALIASAGLAVVMLSGCATATDSRANYDEIYKVSVAETVERLEIYVRQDGMNLTARDRGAMMQFINLYGNEGDGAMYLNMPSNAASSGGMRQAQAEIQNLMMQAGLSHAPVQTGQYQAAPGASAPAVLSFRRLATVPFDCAMGYDVMSTTNNQAYDGFGCADRANFATMIGDPRQLVQPYESIPADNTRRRTGYSKWKTGASPASENAGTQDASTE